MSRPTSASLKHIALQPKPSRRAPQSQRAVLANVDDRLRKAVAAFQSKNSAYWEFKDETGRIEAHAYYQYPAMMVPSMQRVLLQTVLKLQPTIRDLSDPFAGSGTLVVEGMSEGLSVTAYDVNPLAVLLCRAKSEVFDTEALRKSGTAVLNAVLLRLTRHGYLTRREQPTLRGTPSPRSPRVRKPSRLLIVELDERLEFSTIPLDADAEPNDGCQNTSSCTGTNMECTNGSHCGG